MPRRHQKLKYIAPSPGAFRILASRDQAGAMVGYGLWWMHMIGVLWAGGNSAGANY